MMFLQFFIWGAWYTTIAVYMTHHGMETLTHWPYTVNPIAAIVAPFFLGWGILALWRAPQTKAIFVGAGMVAISVGITAQVLAPPLLSLSFRAAQRARQDRLTCYARLPRARRLPV